MTTVFPGAIDALPRPAPTTHRDAGGGLNLSTVVDNISDAIEAVETVLGAGISTPNGVIRKLAEVSGTGASGVLEFSSIPATYRSLRLVLAGRTDTAGVGGSEIDLTYETSPTAGSYHTQRVVMRGATLVAGETIAGNLHNIASPGVPSAGAAAGLHSTYVIDFVEYANTSVMKTFYSSGAAPNELLTTWISFRLSSGVWASTAAINRIRLTLVSGNWTTTSRATLYGIPG